MATETTQGKRLAALKVVQQSAKKGGVSFLYGGPDADALKGANEMLQKATAETMANTEDLDDILGYGPEKGCDLFLNELACFLTGQYGDEVHCTNLMVTAAATQGLHLVFSLLLDRSSPVLVEDPTFFWAIKIIGEDLNMNLVPVATGDTGMDLDALDEKLTSLKASMRGSKRSEGGRFWAAVNLVTVFSNPAGNIYSPEKCQRLVQVARKHDVLVVVDDVYNFLWYPPSSSSSSSSSSAASHALTQAPPRLRAFDRPGDAGYDGGHVVSVGTFSKCLAPGIRLGWIEAPQKIISSLSRSGLAQCGGCFNHYISKLVTSALRSGDVARHLTRVRVEYSKKMDRMCEILERHMPAEVKFIRPQGGFFLWLQFSKSVDAFEFLKFAADKYGLLFLPGVLFSVNDKCQNCARLSISGNNMDAIESGVRELCVAYKDYCRI